MSHTDADDEESIESETAGEQLRAWFSPLANPGESLGSAASRITSMPRIMKLWLVFGAVLFALESSIYLSAIRKIGLSIAYFMNGMGGIPNWIAGNFENAFGFFFAVLFGDSLGDTLGFIVGSLVHDVVSVAMLFVVASVLYWWVMPFRVIDLLSVQGSRRRRSYIERSILTAVLVVIAILMSFTPVGALVHSEIGLYASTVERLVDALPTLTSPDTIPNNGHQTPSGGWEGTFLGLTPAQAWALRTLLVFVYAFVTLAWVWKGYNIYRDHYREADWTPRDDTLRRFRTHYWGMFGFCVVFMFVVLAAWAPAIAPQPIQHNVYQPWTDDATFEYLNEESGEVEEITHGLANIDTRSQGESKNVGPNSYDTYNRYAPLGTTDRGQDLLTHLAYGARTSLIIGLTAIGLGSAIAVVLSLITAYYKGLADLITIIASDTIISIPAFLLIMLLSVLFASGEHPIAEPLDGGLLLALVLAFAYWPGLWRSIRGPALQVAEAEWVDAAKSYGQSPPSIMRKHMAPYIAGYIMIYGSLLLGAAVIVTAALSFLGLGISPPTPEWGRIISDGRQFISTQSWHISTISGLMIVFVVVGFNALGDGIRDAIDPQADIEQGQATAAGGGG